MARRRLSYLTDEQWAKVEHLFPVPKRRKDGRGRPWHTNRDALEGIIFVLITGARWRDVPPPLPSGPTCWRRLRDWEEAGVWRKAWEAILVMLKESGQLKTDETYLDATFRAAKKGATQLG